MVYNRKVILFFLSLLFIVLLIFLVKANDVLTVKTDIIGPRVSIQVPNEIDLGNISNGDTPPWMNFTINNTGNVKVRITSELINSDHEVFNYIEFDTTTEAIRRVDNFTTTINKPSLDEITSKNISVRINLEDYNGTAITEDIPNAQAQIRFLAMDAT
ncbi:hypothetical protein J4466_04150 [Candidatus Pacearchaeota archaeon]|nr:hypothetical protein [Candidatus Pacearchaeota archaeon]